MENINELIITILAAGHGKRMKSDLPKVLHKVNDEPMLVSIIKKSLLCDPLFIILVVSNDNSKIVSDCVKIYFQDVSIQKKIKYAVQEVPLGTGDAAKSTLPLLKNYPTSYNLILNGDSPLISIQTLKSLKEHAFINKSDILITSIDKEDPTGCGRILINKDGKFMKIVEEKDCNDDQRSIKEINCGIYIVKVKTLQKFLPKIDDNNAQKEYYLTDIVKLYRKGGDDNISLFKLGDDKQNEIFNVNTKEELDRINNLFI